MAEIIIPDEFVEVILQWESMSPLGSSPVTTLGLHLTAPFDLATWVANVSDVFQHLLNPLDSDWAAHTVKVRVGDSVGPPYVFHEISTPTLSGTAGGGAQTPNTCVLLKKGTVDAGRKGRGRTFLPGVPEGAVDDRGVLSSAFLDDMATAITDFGIALGDIDSDGVWLLNSRPGDTPRQVISFAPSPIVAIQSRRLRR